MYDYKMIMKMGLDRNALKGLYDVYKVLNKDKAFTLYKYYQMMVGMIKGEKLIKHENTYITSTFMPPFPSRPYMTNINAVTNMDQVFIRQIHARRTAPISMYLCVTDKCPNNCVYCSSKNRKTENELTTDEWIDTIKTLQDMNTSIIGITGGEPMVRKDIYQIVEAIDDRSTSILFTSGVNLTLEKAKKLKSAGLFGLGISLDSYDRETHNANRGSDKAFDFALKAFRISKKAGLYTVAQTVIVKDEVDEKKLFRLFRLAKNNGADEVKILEPIISGNLLTDDSKTSSMIYDKQTRKRLIEIQHKANKLKGMPKISTFAYTESKEKFGCGAGNQHSYISSCGDLYPCDFVPMSFGNVRDEKVDKLWLRMNKVIGLPKTSCFAMKINQQIYDRSNGELPLGRVKACEICRKNQSKVMPDYYIRLQG